LHQVKVPDVAADRIGAIWKLLVAFVLDALMSRQGVRAVYLRGWIRRGLAIENVSDADFFDFSEANFDAVDMDLEKAVKSMFPFAMGLELSRLDQATFNKIRRPQRRPYFHVLLKRQCPVPGRRGRHGNYRAIPNWGRDGQSCFFARERVLAVAKVA
jgi:hypothetical protein